MSEREYPHSDDAERSVLGAAMQSKDALIAVLEVLRKEDFFSTAHAEIFDAMHALYRDDVDVDIVTLSDILKRRGKLGYVGGAEALTDLPYAAPSPSGAKQYAQIVKQKSLLRRLIRYGEKTAAEAFGDGKSAIDVLTAAQTELYDIALGSTKGDYTQIGNIVERAHEKTIAHVESGRKLLGITTGFEKLDDITKGFQKEDLIIVAARPSVGKTALALSFALNAALKEDATVMFFSLEMGEIPLAERLISILAGIELQSIKDGAYLNNQDEMMLYKDAAERFADMKLFIDETSGASVDAMTSKCLRLKQEQKGIDLVVIDYLQLMEITGSGRPENRTLEIAAISRRLKQMAKELDCPVVVLSQLTRDIEKRKGSPVLSDLRDSGAIEQDGDLIMFIHNMTDSEQEKYNNNEFTRVTYNNQTMRQILILKHRNGETGEVFLSWVGRYTKFADLDYGGAGASPEPEEETPF